MTPNPVRRLLLASIALAISGCATEGVDTTYGKVRSSSLNGTGTFAGLLRERGHDTRTFSRLGTRLEEWADAIVRFSPLSGPPAKNEAEWYDRWLNEVPGRVVVYIPHDFDATHEYWSSLLGDLPPDASPRLIERVTEARDKSANLGGRFPAGGSGVAPANAWFQVEAPKGSALEHKTLGGPWGEALDAAKVALPNRSSLKLENERVLLSADGLPVVIDWESHNRSRVLVVSNGAFLLNEPMTNPARLPLASRVADWISWQDVDNSNDAKDRRPAPKRVAFVEGYFVTVDKIKPTGDEDHRLEIQLGLLGLAACLAAAPRLGKARPEAASGADRPVAHPEALGALLARTGKASDARGMLEAYRRWRTRPGAAARHGKNLG